jgi:hypothetical protein
MLFGRTRLKKANMDDLFALPTAQITLEADVGWKPAGRAGVCLKPVTSGTFAQVEAELRELVEIAARDIGSVVDISTDEYGYRWLVLEDPDFEDLVTRVHLAGRELEEQGYGAQLLSAVFRFRRSSAQSTPGYVIYNYKRGNFYPFCPTGDKERDNSAELRVSALMEEELPMEKELERWFPVWDCPV